MPRAKLYAELDDFAPEVQLIHKAMGDGKCIAFTCDDKPRIVEAHAVGLSSKDGGVVVRGFQVAGGASRPLPQWSLFRLDRMTDVRVMSRDAEAPRDGYRQGDAQMSPVLFELEI